MLLSFLSLAVAFAGAAPADVGPQFKSAGPLAFGPENVLFVADNLAAVIYALELDGQASGKTAGTKDVPGPMSQRDGLPYIKPLDEQGKEVIDPFLPLGNAFWAQDGRRYTVFFDPGRVKTGILPNEQMGRPLREGRRYSLVVSEKWPMPRACR